MAAKGSLSHFWALERGDKLLLAEAAIALARASLAIKFTPFRKVVSAAGTAATVDTRDQGASTQQAMRVTWAVNALARRLPWRIVCFQKGLATHRLLHRRGIASLLHYGVAQTAAEGVKAHVWVTYAGRAVIGGEEAAGYTCLATFPPSASTTAAVR